MMKSGFLNKLKQFGLNSYQAKLWMALLSRGVATAGELSDISNVPRSRAYDVLETLEKKGFIMMKVGKPIKYIAVPPNEVLKRVKNKIKEEAEKEAKQIEGLMDSDILSDLSTLHSNGISKVEPNDLVASVKGRKNINYHISRMFGDAKNEIIILSTADGFVRKADTIKRHSKELKAKKVKIRIACPLTPTTQRVARDIKSIADVRESNIRSRFVIVDKTKMIFMLQDDEKTNARYDNAVNLESVFFTTQMHQLFEMQWNKLPRIN